MNATTQVNPATFLEYFARNGGGYCITPDGQLWLGVVQTNTAEVDRRLATQLLRQLSPDDTQRIRDHIVGLGDAVTIIPVRTAPTQPDVEILAAWDKWKATHQRLEAMEPEELTGESAAEAAIWREIDAAEIAIRNATATTPRGIEIQCLIALEHSVRRRPEQLALLAEDLPALRVLSEEWDWTAQMLFAAVLSAHVMGA